MALEFSRVVIELDNASIKTSRLSLAVLVAVPKCREFFRFRFLGDAKPMLREFVHLLSDLGLLSLGVMTTQRLVVIGSMSCRVGIDLLDKTILWMPLQARGIA